MNDLTTSEIEAIRQVLIFWSFGKWIIGLIIPAIGGSLYAIYKLVKEGTGYLASMSNSLRSVEHRLEGLETELGRTQAAVHERAIHE